MELVAIPSYADVFGEEPPEIKDLIADVPSKAVIALLSAINAELFLEDRDEDTQLKLFRFVTKRFTEKQKNQIFKSFYPFVKEGKKFFPLFNLAYTTTFIEYELLNFRNFHIEDTNPEQEFRVFKSYLIIIQKVNDESKNIFNGKPLDNEEKEQFFQIKTWPFFIKQFDFSYKVEPIFQAIKSLVTFDHLYRNEDTQIYVKSFLSKVGKNNFWQYVFDFIELVKISFDSNIELNFRNFSIIAKSEFEPFLDFLSIDLLEFQNDKKLQIDFLGIRKKPLLKIDKSTYLVMYWNFLYNQVNLGMLFDFYARSGINSKFKSFPDFKNYTATAISEDLLFKNIIRKSFSKKGSKLIFDNKISDGLPDCYYRQGKYIYLFEFKDCLMPADVIHSSDYKKIKADIDSKFISNNSGKNKGIRQLLQQVKELNIKPYKSDDFIEEGIKKRNIVVYPILVYTHFMYSMPGINNYLNKHFRKEFESYFSENKLELAQVRDITMIDFEFFYRNFLNLAENRIKFKDLLDEYHKRINRQEKKASKSADINEFINSFSSFDEIKLDYKNNISQGYSKGYIGSLLEVLQISPNINNSESNI
ncbi:hypothetical protein AAE02nite_33280 [Adhaeribacter aerolatus]|uniref:Uncharacterized protein n=1 Tax=Adhaeribacter aerolatus TaxID=670289 RepID=A0A512B119_9BACT|nr:hypothetical protein [Adhaeribacter aerolatus]GEO05664.1 hypothetical protein AAE02nite_33280 [Adhaeribacter aerolatus]